MATEWVLVNTRNNTLYDLGKGPWYEFNPEDFQDGAAKKIEYECCFTPELSIEISNELKEFTANVLVSDLRILTDDNDEIWSHQYVCIGTRYRDHQDPSYRQKIIEEWNIAMESDKLDQK